MLEINSFPALVGLELSFALTSKIVQYKILYNVLYSIQVV
jgi:hypothetical protein